MSTVKHGGSLLNYMVQCDVAELEQRVFWYVLREFCVEHELVFESVAFQDEVSLTVEQWAAFGEFCRSLSV